MDVWSYSLGNVHTWSGALAGSQREPGKHERKMYMVYAQTHFEAKVLQHLQ